MKILRKPLFCATFAVAALVATAAQSQCFNNGVMRVRSGPGQDHSIIGTVPAGTTVNVVRCVEPDDGRSLYKWCLIQYGDLTGWVSGCAFR